MTLEEKLEQKIRGKLHTKKEVGRIEQEEELKANEEELKRQE